LFSKAFDTVPQKELLNKLHSYGIEGNIHQWLSSFLQNRSLRVVVEGEHSDNAHVDSGVHSAGTDRSYKCTGRRVVGLGTTKALYCRCAYYTVLNVVPIDYKRQSSAKSLTWDLTHSGRSFMNSDLRRIWLLFKPLDFLTLKNFEIICFWHVRLRLF
jgi:hypothetical protein